VSANTLTGLIRIIYRNLDVVSQEAVGYAPSVSRDAEASRAALNQVITINRTPPITASDIVPAMIVTEADGVEMDPVSMAITKSRKVALPWLGEEILSLQAPGPGHNTILDDEIQQAFRTLRNEIDVDLGVEIKNTASRAIGAAGSTPFNNTINESADALKVIIDNGAPQNDLRMVINSTAGAQLRKNTQLTKVNEAGTDQTLRNGLLLDLNKFQIRESAGVQTTPIGTGSGYVTDTPAAATLPIGTTEIHVDTGTGTSVAGDVVTFAGDTNKYIVATGFAGDGDSDLVIAAPGLRETLADGVAMTIGSLAVQNSFFSRSGVILLNRLPALPGGKDMATDRFVIIDSINNLVFDIALYLGYHMAQWEIGTSWGVKNIKPEHTGTLLG